MNCERKSLSVTGREAKPVSLDVSQCPTAQRFTALKSKHQGALMGHRHHQNANDQQFKRHSTNRRPRTKSLQSPSLWTSATSPNPSQLQESRADRSWSWSHFQNLESDALDRISFLMSRGAEVKTTEDQHHWTGLKRLVAAILYPNRCFFAEPSANWNKWAWINSVGQRRIVAQQNWFTGTPWDAELHE